MSIITNEWRFDLNYDAHSMEVLYEGLHKSVTKWTDDAYRELRRHLHKHPSQRSAATIEGSRTDADIAGQKVWLLKILLCDEGPLGDFHCITYVGPEGTILKRRDEIKAGLAEQISSGGTDGFILEQDLS